jgi:lipopolysaccharide transport system ATP-binding protein
MMQRLTNREEILVRCEHVSKKFCRTLKRSLWYGVKDMMGEFIGRNGKVEIRSGEFWAVKDVSFELRRGECLGLIGHNGAGKSTLLKMLNGLIKPDQGRIELHGLVGALIELGAGFNPILTGRENIYNKGAILGFTKKEIDQKFEAIVDFAEIEEFIDMPVQNYSSGMKVRLGFAVSAQMDPDVLLIDEALAVGDLGFIIKCLNRMAEIVPQTGVIFVSHSMPMVARICTSALLLEKGQEEYLGTDVPWCIELYTHKFRTGKMQEQGAGEVNLRRIGLRSKNNEDYVYDDSFIHEKGTNLQVYLELAVLNPEINELNVALKILDQQLREVIDCISSETTQPFRPKDAKIYLEISLTGIYLNAGKHTISIVAMDPETKKLYSRLVNTISFAVRSRVQGWATSIVPGDWCQLEEPKDNAEKIL